MAGPDDPFDEKNYKGFSKYFNPYTVRGRSNSAKLWLSVYVIGFVIYKVTKSGKAPPNDETLAK